jgi:hypothetical protein
MEGEEEQIFASHLNGCYLFSFLLFHCFNDCSVASLKCHLCSDTMKKQEEKIKLTTSLLSAPQVVLLSLQLPYQ